MRWAYFSFAVALAGLATLPGCGRAADAKVWKVALVLPGAISDKGFNAEAYEGLLRIKQELGATISFSESTPMANYERVTRTFAEEGNDIIILNGLEFGDLVKRIAPDYPQQDFIVTDSDGLAGPNFCSLRGKAEDAAFLCGVLAGLTTKSNHLGAVVGFDYPLLVTQVEAFRLGARSSNPKATLNVTYLGTFDDPSKGKEAALAQINAGVDLIYHNADNSGVGVIQACAEKGIKAIGWGLDQNPLAPKAVITSELLNTAFLIEQEARTIMEGKFTGQPVVAGFALGGVGLADYHGLVPAATAQAVEAWKAALISGAVRPTYTLKRDGALQEPPVLLPPVVKS
jgi:basic membrane lipoprotein Med (substrate-binding protein (PBP1-ABC) superfamily)